MGAGRGLVMVVRGGLMLVEVLVGSLSRGERNLVRGGIEYEMDDAVGLGLNG